MKIDKDLNIKVKFLHENNQSPKQIADRLGISIQRVYHSLNQLTREKFNHDSTSILYHSKEWQMMREMVLQRDDYKCVRCGSKSKWGNALQVEHKLSKAYHPELAFDMNNLITLCESCHRKTKTFKSGAKKVGRKI